MGHFCGGVILLVSEHELMVNESSSKNEGKYAFSLRKGNIEMCV